MAFKVRVTCLPPWFELQLNHTHPNLYVRAHASSAPITCGTQAYCSSILLIVPTNAHQLQRYPKLR